MNPITLKIKGLNSFNEEQLIDFGALTRYGIFGVFGPTGSGKTTIIDAITIALYDKVPRIEKERSIRQAFNLNCDEIYISFSFSIYGAQEVIYTVERSYKKTSSSHKPVLARLQKKGETQEILSEKSDETTRKINEIIGLTYDDFVRSVILPQGKFSEFLFLVNKERRAMLERIFRLERYGESLKQRVLQKFNDCKNEIALTDSQLEIIGDVSAEKLREERKALESVNKSLLSEKEIWRSKLGEYETLKKLCEYEREYKKCALEKEKLLARRGYMEEAEAKLQISEKAERVVPFITQRKDVAERLAKINDEKTALEKDYEKLNKKYEEIKESYLQAQHDKEEKYPTLLQNQAKISEALKLRTTEKDLENQRNRLLNEHKAKKKDYELLSNRADSIEKEIAGVAAELSQIEDRKARIYVEPDTRRKLEEFFEREKKASDTKKEMDKLREKISKHISEREKSIEEEKALCDKVKIIEAELIHDKQCEDMRLARRLAAALEKGKPCIVCGSTEHPKLMNQEAPDMVIDIEAKDKELKRLLIQQASLSGGVSRANNVIDENEEALKELSDSYSKISDELDKCKRETGIDDFKEALAKIRKNEKESDLLSKKEVVLRKAQEQKRLELEEVRKGLNEIRSKIESVLISGTEKREMIQNLREQILRLTEGKNPEDELVVVNAAINSITKLEKDLKTLFTQTETRKQNTYDSFLERKKLSEANQRLLTESEEKLSEMLSELGFASADDAVKSVVKDKERLKSELNEFNDRLKGISLNMVRLEETLRGHEDIEGRTAAHKNEIAVLDASIHEKTRQTAVMGERIVEMEKNLDKEKELSLKRKKLEHNLDILDDLATLFKGNHFVEFIAIRQLRHIAAETSARLSRMTGGRFALELDESDFVIQDNFNGGIRRSPKTLSGGETFLVSLCLALALSTRVQLTQSAPLQLFFLDEGFGTLDSSLLDTVMDTLEKLRLEKLNVGVITHVEELKDRIPAKLIVSPAIQGVRGTRVTLSIE